jgi:hypothetical protein
MATQHLNKRQKTFARLVHEQVPPYRAYALAGYRPHESNPYRLSENERVKRYLTQLEAATKKRHEITVDGLLTDLEAARIMARNARQAQAMISATLGQAKLCGLITDKRKTKHSGGMSLEACVRLLREALADKADAVLKALGVENVIQGDAPEASGSQI